MKKTAGIVIVMGIVLLSGCGKQPESGNVRKITENHSQQIIENHSEQSAEQNTQEGAEMEYTEQENLKGTPENSSTVQKVETDQIYIKVGDSTLTAVLEDNESAEALKELIADGPLTISASNYGGFEKVCSLGTELPRNDSQTTTQAGDICLYNGNQIVIFYGSNSWAYTRLGNIPDADAAELEKILSGAETEITLSMEEF